MPIVAASVVPHSPLLLPTVAKHHGGLFALTTSTMTNQAAEWYAAKPDAVMILSPHGIPKGVTAAIHSAEQYRGGFSEFGDVVTTVTPRGAVAEMHRLRSAAEHDHLPLHLQTYEELDYGTSVPLTFLAPEQSELPLCSILIGTQHTDELLRLAALLREFVISSKHRWLVIASGDMTRRRERTPDARRRPSSEERAFSSAITAIDASQITSIKPHPTTCGYGPLLVLLNMLHGVADHGTIESFEAPLGVGLLTASFSL